MANLFIVIPRRHLTIRNDNSTTGKPREAITLTARLIRGNPYDCVHLPCQFSGDRASEFPGWRIVVGLYTLSLQRTDTTKQGGYMKPQLAQRSAIAFGLAGVLSLSPAAFGQSHDHGGEGSEKSDSKKEGKEKGHGGGMMMMGHMADLPGNEVEKCHAHEGMPPHYCEPVYHVMSSVRGVAIDEIAAAGDQAVIVTLRELNVTHPGIGQKIAIVGGGGDLAGAVIVEGGWKESKKIQLNLTGDGTIYSQKTLKFHIFPLTGP